MARKVSIVEEAVSKLDCAVGLALVIANDYEGSQLTTLRGTLKDADAMCNALSKLRYAVVSLNNVTKPRLREVASEITTVLSCCSCNYKRLVFVFAGHGTSNDFLCTQEGEELSLNEIIEMWLPQKCPNLAHIQKIYFIDACRGTATDTGCTVPRGRSHLPRGGRISSESLVRFPSNGNYLVALATTPGHMSYEIQGGGGRWLYNVSKMLLKSDKSVLDILTKVNEELMKLFQDQNIAYVQQPTLHSTLNEEVYFLKESYTGYGQMDSLIEKSYKQQLQDYCNKHNKPSPTYKTEKKDRKTYCAKVYVARTCGWTNGELSSTLKLAEESAAANILLFLQQ